MTRDYSKFLKADGRLNVRYFPRPVYLNLLKRYRSRDDVIAEVFAQHYWLWDLNERERKVRADGVEPSRAQLSDELIAEMDDKDWWQVMAAFEEHLQLHFRERAPQYADLIDAVYDLNEADGWRDRHYDPVKPSS